VHHHLILFIEEYYGDQIKETEVSSAYSRIKGKRNARYRNRGEKTVWKREA
jgi:hypothetical protein